MKVNVTLDDALMERIDAHAEDFYMSRSGFISLACAQYLNQFEAMRCMKEMTLALRKIADTGSVDDDTMKQLEDLERVFKFISQQKGV